MMNNNQIPIDLNMQSQVQSPTDPLKTKSVSSKSKSKSGTGPLSRSVSKEAEQQQKVQVQEQKEKQQEKVQKQEQEQHWSQSKDISRSHKSVSKSQSIYNKPIERVRSSSRSLECSKSIIQKVELSQDKSGFKSASGQGSASEQGQDSEEQSGQDSNLDSKESGSNHTLEDQNQGELFDFGFPDPVVKNQIEEYSPKERFYRFNDEIGFGSYKSVFRAYDSETGREVAWNVIKLVKLPPQQRKRLTQEISILKNISHPKVINFINAWLNKNKNQMIFMTQMVSGGSLKHHLKRIKKPRLKVIKQWCRQILEGLEYLHSQEPPVIHRDIKCQNIFINTNTNQIKIGDLGLAIAIRNTFAQTLIGTPQFMAPQIFEGKYGTSVDIYAFGMCILEIVTLQTPYQQCDSLPTIYKCIENRIKPQSLNMVECESLKKFIMRCFSESNIRPSAAELLKDPFFELNPEEDNKEIEVRIVDIQVYVFENEVQTETKKSKEQDEQNIIKPIKRDSIISINNFVNQLEMNTEIQKRILQKSEQLFREMYKQYRFKLINGNQVMIEGGIQNRIIALETSVLKHLQQEIDNKKITKKEQPKKIIPKQVQISSNLPPLSRPPLLPSEDQLISSEKRDNSLKMSYESLNFKQINVPVTNKPQQKTVHVLENDKVKDSGYKTFEIKSEENAISQKNSGIRPPSQPHPQSQKTQQPNNLKSSINTQTNPNQTHKPLPVESSQPPSNPRRPSIKERFLYQTNSQPIGPYQCFFQQAPPVFQNSIGSIHSPSARAKTQLDPKFFDQNTESIPQKFTHIERPISSRPVRNEQYLSNPPNAQFHRTNTFRSQKQSIRKEQDIGILLKAKKIEITFPISKTNNNQKDAISLIQNILNKLLDEKLEALGIFGHYTEQLIKRYQNLNKLSVNGIVDKELYLIMVSDFERSLSSITKDKEIKELKEKQDKLRKEKEHEAQKLLSELEKEILDQS